MVIRIHLNQKVRVIDKSSPYFNETGAVARLAKYPVGMRLRNQAIVKLDNSNIEEAFLPEQLEVIG